MNKEIRNEIIDKHCYSDLVYGRIRKKLSIELSNKDIEDYIYGIILRISENNINDIGKNYYLNDYIDKIRLTINRNTFRIITVDKIK